MRRMSKGCETLADTQIGRKRRGRSSGKKSASKGRRDRRIYSSFPTTIFKDLSSQTIQQWMQQIKTKSIDSFRADFWRVRKDFPKDRNILEAKAHWDKNRYGDVLCWDETRVKLKGTYPDYIHASYVDSYSQTNDYICTQAPLDTTTEDFWEMVWQQKTLVIAMLCQMTEEGERGKPKCAMYYPMDEQQSLDFGRFNITCMSRKRRQLEKSDYCVMTSVLNLLEKRTRQKRKIQHVQMENWPDKGTPRSGIPCLQLMTDLKHYRSALAEGEEEKRAPIVIHCSAGIGRTGTIVAIEVCCERMKKLGRVDVAGTVQLIRRQRMHAVQTDEQYIFVHKTILESLAQQHQEYKADYLRFTQQFNKRFPRQPY